MKTNPSFLRKLAAVAAFAALSLTSGQAQTTATTTPVGFTSLAIPAGTSLVVPTLTNSTVYAGMAAISPDGLTATPVTAPAWTPGAYAMTTFGLPTRDYPTHYFEVVAGAQEGLVLDVSTNDATTLTLLDAAPVGLRGTTVQFTLRHHATLDTVFASAIGLSAFADAFSVFNHDGTQSIRYYDGASFVDETYSNPAGHTVIYPGQGLVANPVGPVTLTMTGTVKATKTQVFLYAAALNVVGPLSPASSTLLNGSASLAAGLAPYADSFNNFTADGQMTITGTYYSDGTSILNGSYSPLQITDLDAIPLNRGVIINVTADTVWTVNSPLP